MAVRHGSRRHAGLIVAIVAALCVALCWTFLRGRDVASSDESAGDEASILVEGGAETESSSEDGAAHQGGAIENEGDQEDAPQTLEEAAAAELESYRDSGNCVLVEAGYADFLGNVWCALVQGDGWVEICVVTRTEAGGSRVSHTRLLASEWQERLGRG